MAFSPPQCAVNMEQRLAALRRDQEIDGLRVYLIKYNLFPRNRDPENSPIRVEELKELVKHWKLHRSRGFWRDHPEKEDLVRALLHHIRSEATNKKRRQEAQDKYSRSHKGGAGAAGLSGQGSGGAHGVGSGEMSDAAKRDFSMILTGGKDCTADGDGGGGDASGDAGDRTKSLLKNNRMGGDLFYQRGDYDEGMIYLSRVDKSRFKSDAQNPRNELLTTSASAVAPLGHLVQMGGGKEASSSTGKPPLAMLTTTMSHSQLNASGSSNQLHSSGGGGPSVASLTREMKLKCVDGLYNMSCHRGFEAQMLREGALSTVASLLKTDDLALRLLAAATLLNLTAITTTAAASTPGKPTTQAVPSFHAAAATTTPSVPPLASSLAVREVYGKMMDDGVLASLLELAHTPHPTVKAYCARALFRFTIDENHHFRMVHEGVVVALTQLLTAAMPATDDAIAHRHACVNALVNLAAIPRAVTCDVLVSTLISLAKSATAAATTSSSHMNAMVLRGCGQALLNLSILPTTRSSMMDEGAMLALSLLASTKQVPLSQTVSRVLCNCAAIRTNQELMVKNNATTLISDLLDLVNRSFETLRLDQEQAATEGEQDQQNDPAVEMVRASLDRIRRNCVNAIAHFCCNAKLPQRIVGAGFVSKLLAILQLHRGGADDQEEVGEGGGGGRGGAQQRQLGHHQQLDDETEKFCVISLANLALDDRSRPNLVQDGAVPVLLRILKEPEQGADQSSQTVATGDSGRTLLKLDCVTALSNLMLHPKNFTRMVDEGVVPALLALVQRSENAQIQRACLYAMLNMAKDPSMKTRLAQATGATASLPKDTDASAIAAAEPEPGAIPTMLAFASKQLANSELCGVCVSFLHHLSTRSENYDVLYYEGAVGVLVRVLQKPSHAEPVHVIYNLWLTCMATLSNLANHKEKRATLLDDGVLEAMQHVLTVSHADTRKRDKRTDTKIVLTQFATSQIVFKLQDLCCGPNKKGPDVPSFFSSLLLLSTQSAARNSRLEKKAVLYQQKTVLRCALTIARCTALSSRGLGLLAGHNEFPPALNGIMRTGLHEAQVCAAIALCNLATERGTSGTSGGGGTRKASSTSLKIWRDATIDDFIVITLLRLNSDHTKEICAKALFNLLTHDDTRNQMIKDGVLYALIKLSCRLESEEVRDLALRSIYNISLSGGDDDDGHGQGASSSVSAGSQQQQQQQQQQLLLDMEIVRILTKMYQADFSKEMKRLLCGILSNLSAVRDHENQILREGALSVLKHLAKVRDPETKVYAANILYNLSCCVDVVDLLVRGSAGGGGSGASGGSAEDVTGAASASSAMAAASSGGAGGSEPANVLSLLTALLKAENRDVRRYAARTIANLSGNPLAVQLMTEAAAATSGTTATDGGGGMMVGVLNDVLKRTMASCVETTSACVFALRNLLTIVANQQRFIDCNGVVTLAAILNCSEMESSDQATLDVATDLLCALANFEQGTLGFEERLVKDGIIRALLAIAKRSSSTPASGAMNIMTSLSNLSKNRRCHDLMLRDGVLDIVALLCRTSHSTSGHSGVGGGEFKGLTAVKGEEFCHHCVVVLRNLAHLEDTAATATPTAAAAAPAPSTTSTQASGEGVKGQRLSSQPAVLQILLALALSTSAETREHVVIALHNLATFKRCRAQLLKYGGVKEILRLGTNATSAVKRHICGLTLQLLSKQNDPSGDADPHSASIKQDGIIAAIAAIAEPHHHDVLVLATKALHAIEIPKPISTKQPQPAGAKSPALLLTGNAPVVQRGAQPDWAKVSITSMALWPELESLATAVNTGKDDDGDDADEEDLEDSDDEISFGGGSFGAAVAPMASAAASYGGGGGGATQAKTKLVVPSSPGHSRLRAPSSVSAASTTSSVTVPRTCSMETVLGLLQLLDDESLEKVRVNVEAEMASTTAQRRSAASTRTGGGGADEQLPALLGRPASSPGGTAGDDAASASDSSSKTTTAAKRSTLSLAREDAAASSSGSQGSPIKSPTNASTTGGSMATTPKRKSRTLEPLGSPVASREGRLGSSASTSLL